MPVKLTRNYLIFAHSHEDIIFVENGNKRKQLISVLIFIAKSGILSENIKEHILLVVTEVNLWQHNLLST
jgi:hypothetical protein